MASTKPARGMRDFLPADVRRRTYVIDAVRDVYERYGFEPLETPAVENLETLMGKYGEEGNQLIFRVQKRGESFETALGQRVRLALDGLRQAGDPQLPPQPPRPPGQEAAWQAAVKSMREAMTPPAANELSDLALRYDLTVPLARVVAEYRAQLPKFFKRYQIQPVWRADRPARGRFREFYQCDVDILGTTSPAVEAELCAAVSDVLDRLGFTNFVIRLNHRQLLAAILDVAGVPADRAGDALVALDKLDKIGRDGVQQELSARAIDAHVAERLLDVFATGEAIAADDESNARTLDRLAAFVASGTGSGGQIATDTSDITGAGNPGAGDVGVGAAAGAALTARGAAGAASALGGAVGGHAGGAAALGELRQILAGAAQTSARGRIAIDPSLARGLSYYTGAIMEIAVPDLAGSLGGGGRYDNLVGMFLGQDVPACGFSLGLERIIVVMTERGMFPVGLDAAPADVMVTVWSADRLGDALALARDLRAAAPAGGRRLRVDVYPEPDKIGKQFKYASSRGIPKVVVAGDDEIANGTVTIKDMTTGEQQTVPRANAAAACQPR